MATRESENAAVLVAAVGQELGVSDWFGKDRYTQLKQSGQLAAVEGGGSN